MINDLSTILRAAENRFLQIQGSLICRMDYLHEVEKGKF